ncbi:MAG: hypothetical protein ACI4PP_08005, partial [Clostridia bacterium]
MKKKALHILLVLAMILCLLPTAASAAVTAENDWDIFDATDTYNLPKTQEQIFTAMIQNPIFAEHWATIANSILPETFLNDTMHTCYHEPYTDFTPEAYTQVKYTSKGLRDAVSSCIDQSAVKNNSGVLNSLPDTETPVYYVFTKADRFRSDSSTFESTGYGYYIQLFYDFEIEGIENRFTSPEVADDDTLETLEEKGYNFSLGGSSDSYQVTAENRNDFENTVEKSY